jgi:hypothetical protein
MKNESKNTIQATEITEDTEMMRTPRTFCDHMADEVKDSGKELFSIWLMKPPTHACSVFSVNSVFSVANCFF